MLSVDKHKNSCILSPFKSIGEFAFAVIPTKAGIRQYLVLKNTYFPIKTSRMTNKDFCKSLNI